LVVVDPEVVEGEEQAVIDSAAAANTAAARIDSAQK
jgi:hypothetical protein